MNCKPDYQVSASGGVLLSCEEHGLVADIAFSAYPLAYEMLRRWGEHCVLSMKERPSDAWREVTEPSVIVQSDDMLYLPDHLK